MKLPKVKVPFKRRAPLVLSIIGCLGVVGTGVVAAIQTPKAIAKLEEVKPKTPAQKFLTVAPVYLPAVGVAAGSIASILGANALNVRQQAKLISGYALLNESYRAYKGKVKQLYGEDADRSVRAAIAKDDISELTDEQKHVMKDLTDDQHWFYCSYADDEHKFFKRTWLEIQDAEYAVNRELCCKGYITLDKFLHYFGLPKNPYGGDMVGWSVDYLFDAYDEPWIDFDHMPVEPYSYPSDDDPNTPDAPVYYDISTIIDPSEDFMGKLL